MQFDIGILSGAIPVIASAISALNSCKASILAISIPADFPEGETIKAAAGEIDGIVGMISSAESSVNSTIDRFVAAQAKNNQVIDALNIGLKISNAMIGLLTNKGKGKSKGNTYSEDSKEKAKIDLGRKFSKSGRMDRKC